MKKCELCNSTAKMYCESDQASLCWDCDTRVHTANFLAAKHLRTLLCHACQSPTPWTASGPRLGPTVSVCQACANTTANSSDADHDLENHRDDDDDDDDDSVDEDDQDDQEDQDDNDDDSSDDSGDEDDGDNQVVPLSSTALPPPLISSSSSSENSSKRSSQKRDGSSNSGIGCFSNHSNPNGRFSCDEGEVDKDWITSS